MLLPTFFRRFLSRSGWARGGAPVSVAGCRPPYEDQKCIEKEYAVFRAERTMEQGAAMGKYAENPVSKCGSHYPPGLPVGTAAVLCVGVQRGIEAAAAMRQH